MAKEITTKELRRMSTEDLRREIREQQRLCVKLRLAIRVGGEKDSAKARRARRQLARMETVASEKGAEKLAVDSSERRIKSKPRVSPPSAS